jgi:hypothetical protein
VSDLLYAVNRVRTEDLLREGERQRLAAAAEPAKQAEPPRASRRVAFWPFRQVARAARLGRAPSPVS